MGAQIIKVPGSEDLVVLPRSEYEALIRAAEDAAEDAADVAAYDEAVADPEGMKPMPQPVTDAMLKDHVSLLKAIRLWREMGQQEVAAIADISQGFLSDLENRKRKITADIGRKLAKALDVPERWLV
jgi:antitoxin component HigA of HigAB toxin-antitoxin module